MAAADAISGVAMPTAHQAGAQLDRIVEATQHAPQPVATQLAMAQVQATLAVACEIAELRAYLTDKWGMP